MKVLLIILLVIVGIIALICCVLNIRLMVKLDYTDKVYLKIRWAFLSFDVLPASEKEKKPKKEKPKQEKPPDKEKPQTQTKPKTKKPNPIKVFLSNEGINGLYELLYQTCQALGGFFGKIIRKITIEELFFSLRISEGDAARTAVSYGKICGVVFPMLGYICSHMRVRKYDAEITPDYLANQSEGELHALFSFRPLAMTNGAVVLVFRLLIHVVVRFLKGLKTPKTSLSPTAKTVASKQTNYSEGGAS